MSLAVAYILWALGPFSPALHLLYVGRDDQWVAWCCTGGGFMLGWVRDAWRLPAYVALCDPTSAEVELQKVRHKHTPTPNGESNNESNNGGHGGHGDMGGMGGMEGMEAAGGGRR
jgi:hypothetical protein